MTSFESMYREILRRHGGRRDGCDSWFWHSEIVQLGEIWSSGFIDQNQASDDIREFEMYTGDSVEFRDALREKALESVDKVSKWCDDVYPKLIDELKVRHNYPRRRPYQTLKFST